MGLWSVLVVPTILSLITCSTSLMTVVASPTAPPPPPKPPLYKCLDLGPTWGINNNVLHLLSILQNENEAHLCKIQGDCNNNQLRPIKPVAFRLVLLHLVPIYFISVIRNGVNFHLRILVVTDQLAHLQGVRKKRADDRIEYFGVGGGDNADPCELTPEIPVDNGVKQFFYAYKDRVIQEICLKSGEGEAGCGKKPRIHPMAYRRQRLSPNHQVFYIRAQISIKINRFEYWHVKIRETWDKIKFYEVIGVDGPKQIIDPIEMFA